MAVLDKIDFRDSEASCDQFLQSMFDLCDKVRIAPNRRNGLVAQPREIIPRERHTRDPARIDVTCDLLAMFRRPRLADEKILAGRRAPW